MSTPYYGNKINLISKSEIRYEGYLYAIDAKESTIALAQVRSFGTEDRPVSQPVASREEVYEYIIFRAKDIRDIIVGDFPPSNVSDELGDPAILHAQTGQSATSSISTKPDIPNGTLTSNGALGSSVGASTSPVAARASDILNMAMFTNVNSCNQSNVTSGPPSTGPAFSSTGGYRSGRSTPNPLQRRSPISEEANRLPNEEQSHKEEKSNLPNQQQSNRDNRSQNYQQNYRSGRGNDRVAPSQYKRRPMPHQNQQSIRAMPQMNYRGSRPGPMANGSQKRGLMINRPPPQPRVMNPNRGSMNRNVKHDQASKMNDDYDFEKANKEFEELEIQFSKVKVEDSEKKDDEKKDLESEVKDGDKKDEENVFYDKAKSFFDKISCESIERSKGKVNRTDWKRERKINEETFGLTANYRRSGYRGRGGYTGSYSGYSRQNYSNRNYNHRNAIGGTKNSVPPGNERRNQSVEFQSW